MTALQAVPDTEDGPRYNGVEAAELAGITYRQIDYWTRSGRLGDTRFVGSGRTRSYTFDEIELLRLVKPLLDVGLVLDAAFDYARRAIATGTVRIQLADIYELAITVRDTTPEGATA